MLKDIGLFILACLLISGALWDVFETIILPRRVTRGFGLARFFFQVHLAAVGRRGEALP